MATVTAEAPEPVWVPINDYPGDQRFDSLAGDESHSYYGEIGTDSRYKDKGLFWSWTIIAVDDSGANEDVDSGFVASEEEAKRAVEGWTCPTSTT